MIYKKNKKVKFPDDFYERVIDYICEDECITQDLAKEYYDSEGELEEFCRSIAGKTGVIIEACEGAANHNDWCEINDNNWVFGIECVELLNDKE